MAEFVQHRVFVLYAVQRQQQLATAHTSHHAGRVAGCRQATVVETHIAARPRLTHPRPRRLELLDDRLDQRHPLLLDLRVHVALGDVEANSRRPCLYTRRDRSRSRWQPLSSQRSRRRSRCRRLSSQRSRRRSRRLPRRCGNKLRRTGTAIVSEQIHRQAPAGESDNGDQQHGQPTDFPLRPRHVSVLTEVRALC